jgi:hypothetical protein
LWKSLQKDVRAVSQEFGIETGDDGKARAVPMEDLVKQQYVYDTVNILNDSKDMKDFIQRVGIPEAGNLIVDNILKLIDSNINSNLE